MKILPSVYNEIIENCPYVPPECGGIIGGNNNLISIYCFDKMKIIFDKAEYIPNTDFLSKVIDDWNKSGIRFYGIFHSHCTGCEELSDADILYIQQIMSELTDTYNYLFFPIVLPKEKIVFFKASMSNNSLTIMKENVIKTEV